MSRRGLRRLGLGGAGLGLLVAAGVGILWSGLGLGALPGLVTRFAPPGVRLEAAEVSGRWVSPLSIRGLEVAFPGGRFRADSLSIRFRLGPLLDQELRIAALYARAPRLEWEGAPESEPADGPEGGPAQDDGGAWSVIAEDVHLQDGGLELATASGPYRARDLAARFSGRFGQAGFRARVDTLTGRIDPADGAPPVRLRVAGEVGPGEFVVREFHMDSRRTRLSGSGTLVLPGSGAPSVLPGPVDPGDLRVTAAPLDLRDLPLGWPSGVPATVEASLETARSGDTLTLALQGKGPGPTELRLTGVARPRPAPPDGRPERSPGGTLPDSGDPAGDASTAPLDLLGTDLPDPGLQLELQGRHLPLGIPDPDGRIAGGRMDAELTLHAASLAPGTAYRLAGRLTRAPATVELTGAGRDVRLERMRLAARAQIQVPQRVPAPAGDTLPPASATLTLQMVPSGRLSWSVTASAGPGRLRGEGGAELARAPVGLQLRRLDLEDVDLSTLAPGLPDSRLGGRVTGSFLGATEDVAASGSLRARLSPARVGGVLVDSAGLRADLADDSLAGVAELHTGWGRVAARLAGAAGGEGGGAVLRIREGRFGPVSGPSGSVPGTGPAGPGAPSPGAFQVPLPEGRFQGRLQWGEAGPTGELRVDVDSAALGAATLYRAALTATLDTAEARLRGEGRVGEDGRVRVSARLAGFAAEGSPGDADLLLPRGLRGQAGLTWTGALPNGGRVEGAEADLTLDTGTIRLRGSVRPDDQLPGLGVQGRVRTGSAQDPVAFDVQAAGRLPQLDRLLAGSGPRLDVDSLQVGVSGTWGGAGGLALDGEVDLERVRWRQATLDRARLAGRWDSSGVAVDTLVLDSPILSAGGGGRLPARSSTPGVLTLEGTLGDLSPLGPVLGVRPLRSSQGRVSMDLRGRLDSLALSLQARVQALAVGGVQVSDARLDGGGVRWRPDDVPPRVRGQVELAAQRIATADVDVARVDVEVRGGPDSLEVELSGRVDQRRRGDLRLQIDPRPGRRVARIEEVRLELDEDRWTLDRPSTVTWLNGIRISDLSLSAGGQGIRLHGGVDSLGVVELDAQVDTTRVGTVADLVGFPDLVGWVDGRVSVEGPVDGLGGRARMAASLDSRARRAGPGRLVLALDSDGDSVGVDLEVRHPDGGPLTLEGTVPAAILAGAGPSGSGPAGDSVDLVLDSDGFALAWLAPFVGEETVRGLTGRVRTDLTLSGPVRAPGLEGRLEVSDLRAELPALGVVWSDGRVRARGDGRALVLDTLRVASGRGTAHVEGRIQWPEDDGEPLDLNLEMNEFQAIHNGGLQGLFSGRLRLQGSPAHPRVRGDVEVLSLDVHLDEQVADDGLEDIELSPEDLAMLRERFGYVPPPAARRAPLLDRLTADVAVTLGRDSWIRKRTSPELAIPFAGAVEVEMRPGQDIQAFGTVEAIGERGYIEEFGRRFELESGTIRLEGPVEQARMDVDAVYTIPSHDNPDAAEVAIRLSLEGTRQDLTLALASDPPMENADIVAYLATGRPATGPATFEGGEREQGLLAAGADLALSQMVEVLEDAAARNVGLDVVEIRREGLREATLVAGRYVSPRLYLGFAQPVSLREGDGLTLGGEGEGEVELEYQAYRWLLLNLEGSGSAVRFFLRTRHAY